MISTIVAPNIPSASVGYLKVLGNLTLIALAFCVHPLLPRRISPPMKITLLVLLAGIA